MVSSCQSWAKMVFCLPMAMVSRLERKDNRHCWVLTAQLSVANLNKDFWGNQVVRAGQEQLPVRQQEQRGSSSLAIEGPCRPHSCNARAPGRRQAVSMMGYKS